MEVRSRILPSPAFFAFPNEARSFEAEASESTVPPVARAALGCFHVNSCMHDPGFQVVVRGLLAEGFSLTREALCGTFLLGA